MNKAIGLVILVVIWILILGVLNAQAFDFDARIAALIRENTQIDQAVVQRQQELQQLTQQKVANIGAIAAFREVQAEKVEEKEEEK